MGFDDLADMEAVDVAEIWRENDPPEPDDHDDDEPDEEDPDIAVARKRLDDPAHMAAVSARITERQRNAEIGSQVRQQWREEQRRAEKDQLVESVEAAVDYDDYWDEGYDEDEPRPVSAEVIEAIDRAVRAGADADDLERMGDAVGHDVVTQVVQYAVAERQAQLDAAERQAQYERGVERAKPAITAVLEFRRLGELNPHLDEYAEAAEDYLRHAPVHLIATEEEAKALALRAWKFADEVARVRRENNVSALLHRGMVAAQPGSMLNRQTGELEQYPERTEIDLANNVFGEGPELGPREKGRRWAQGAGDAMAEEAERQQVIRSQTDAALKRALKQQEQEEDEVRGRKFNNPFHGT